MPPKENKNVVERSKPTGMGTFSLGIGGHWTTYKDPSSYPSSTSKGGEGGKGGQWGYSGSNNGQTKVNPQVAKQITDKINVSESAIQNEIGRLKGLNPIASEETLRSAAIQELGIATFEELLELKSYKKEQETVLAVNVAQKITPYVLSLTSGEGSLGIHTASFNGRKSKDGDGISNQVKICLEHLRINGGADALRVLTFTECDLTENDMIYFGNTMLQYSLLLKYLDFSDNRIGDIGTIYLFNSFITLPTGKYPMHHIINLNLSNNGIGDDGVGHIAAYIKGGYMPATTDVNLADNNITDAGTVSLFETLKNESNRLKVLHLEGNNIRIGPFSDPLVKLMEGMKGGIKVLIAKVTNIKGGVEKQGTLFFGSKEEKQAIVKNFLKQAQENGVDVKNVTVSKDIFEGIKNFSKLGKDFAIGWAKCRVVPDSVGSFVGNKIVAKASPLVGEINDAMDKATCYFETFDESASSKEGVQFMVDIGFVEQSELLGAVE